MTISTLGLGTETPLHVHGAHTGMVVFIVSLVALDVFDVSVVFGLTVVVCGRAVVVCGMAVVVYGMAVVVDMAVVVGMAVVVCGMAVVVVALNSLVLSRGHIKIE